MKIEANDWGASHSHYDPVVVLCSCVCPYLVYTVQAGSPHWRVWVGGGGGGVAVAERANPRGVAFSKGKRPHSPTRSSRWGNLMRGRSGIHWAMPLDRHSPTTTSFSLRSLLSLSLLLTPSYFPSLFLLLSLSLPLAFPLSPSLSLSALSLFLVLVLSISLFLALERSLFFSLSLSQALSLFLALAPSLSFALTIIISLSPSYSHSPSLSLIPSFSLSSSRSLSAFHDSSTPVAQPAWLDFLIFFSRRIRKPDNVNEDAASDNVAFDNILHSPPPPNYNDINCPAWMKYHIIFDNKRRQFEILLLWFVSIILGACLKKQWNARCAKPNLKDKSEWERKRGGSLSFEFDPATQFTVLLHFPSHPLFVSISRLFKEKNLGEILFLKVNLILLFFFPLFRLPCSHIRFNKLLGGKKNCTTWLVDLVWN